MKRLYPLLIALFCYHNFMASHVPGGNISYENVGPNTFVITLTVFEDCGTAFYSNFAESIDVTNDCGIPFPATIQLPNVIFQQEVSQLCISSLTQSECNGGSFPGVYMHVWQDTITLPGTCDSWTFAFEDCCRNSSNNLIGTGNNYYWETVLNSNTSPSNSSAVITSQPIPYYCINQTVVYNFGVIEPDGDSLHYSLINAMTGPTTTAPYQGGFSGAVPIPGININPNTGEITFTPTATGNFVVVVLIEEFDANGNLVGSVIQDFQFEIINVAGCSNNNPSPPTGGVTNFVSSGVLVGPLDIQVCEGDSVCFDLTFTDSPGDSIYISSNVSQLFPGATMTQNSFFSPATATFCFVIAPGANPFSTISVDVNDNACPIPGISSAAVGVSVITSTYAGQNVTMCQGVGTQLQASGGSNFVWNVITGDPISIGNNFSCNNCANPVANPAYTTTYEVTSNLAGGCTNIDTVVVTVVPDFVYSLTQSGTSTCLNATIDFNANPAQSGTFTYDWQPPTHLNNNQIYNPTFNSNIPGNFDYEVTITSALGCVKVDTLNVDVAAVEQPNIIITSSPLLLVPGDTAQLFANHTGSNVTSCGTSLNSSCSSVLADTNVGTNMGTNGNTTYPAPFGNWYKSAKHQFLFLASELHSYGISAGKITEIAWETVAQNNAVDTFYSYKVNMGCTNSNSLTNWENNLTNVFSPQDFTVSLGWNNLVLTSPYEWDGFSNLVIEICFNNLNNPYTFNWSTPYELTPFNSTIYYRTDVADACSYTGSSSGLENKRPITKFKVCDVSNPYQYSYHWIPNNNMTNDTMFNPFVSPLTTTTYTAITSYANCVDTSTYTLSVLCDTCSLNISDTACNSYTFNNQTYTQSGFYTDSITSQNSTHLVNLDLTINPTYNISISDTACNSYNFFSQILTQSGIYSNTLTSINGCDSTINVDLNIINSSTQTYSFNLCPNDTLYVNNNMYLSPGVYYDTVMGAFGCEDILIYDIASVNNPTASISLTNDTLFGVGMGGLPPYSYLWNTGEISSFIIANNNGLYSLEITDANNCVSDTVSYMVNSLFINRDDFKELFVYPNPTHENITISINNFRGNIQTEVFDLIGNKLQTNNETTISLKGYAKGIYILKITYGDRAEVIEVVKK